MTARQTAEVHVYCTRQGLIPFKAPQKIKFNAVMTADHAYHAVEGLGPLIHVCHGTISKGIYFMPFDLTLRENRADIICVPGNVHAGRLRPFYHRRIEVTGMPKLDRLFKRYTKDRRIIRQMLSVPPRDMLILIAPTFNQELSLMSQLPDLLRKYAGQKVHFVLKPHGENSSTQMEDLLFSVKWVDGFKVHLAHTMDITPLFSACDLLISDCSSVLYEFQSTGKPLKVVRNPGYKTYALHHRHSLEYSHPFPRETNALPAFGEKIEKSFMPTPFIQFTDGGSSKRVLRLARQSPRADYRVFGKTTQGFERIPWHVPIETSNPVRTQLVHNRLLLEHTCECLKLNEPFVVLRQPKESVSPFFSDTLVSHLRRHQYLDFVVPFKLPFRLPRKKASMLARRLWYDLSMASVPLFGTEGIVSCALRAESMQTHALNLKGRLALDCFTMEGEFTEHDFSSWHCYYLSALPDQSARMRFIGALKPEWKRYQPFLKEHRESLYYFEISRALKEIGQVSEGMDLLRPYIRLLNTITHEHTHKRIRYHLDDFRQKGQKP